MTSQALVWRTKRKLNVYTALNIYKYTNQNTKEINEEKKPTQRQHKLTLNIENDELHNDIFIMYVQYSNRIKKKNRNKSKIQTSSEITLFVVAHR